MPAASEVNASTVRDLLDDATRRLGTASIAQPRLDARLLLAHALNAPGERFYGREDEPVSREAGTAFETAIQQRLNREPVSRILGSRGFWSLEFALDKAALDPRPDSETLIEAVLDHVASRQAPLRVLDLGTGTGCLLLSVLAEFPRARGTGIDISPDCVVLARRNAETNGLGDRASFQTGYWDDGLDAIFDVILCNPPYIPTSVIPTLEPEVAVHEPGRALDGGPDGLECYRELATRFKRILAKNGHIFLETGHDQHADVTAIMTAHGLTTLSARLDLAANERCLVLQAGAG